MGRATWRDKMERIIFEADTPAGKGFDVLLIFAIITSVLAVMLESVESIKAHYRNFFVILEWGFTFLFSFEYLCRLISAKKPGRYALSFYGLVDIIAILPSYLSLVLVGAQSLLVVRSFRLLRIFRVFKLTPYLHQAGHLTRALSASRPKITVFLVGVLATVTTMGAVMYLIEGGESGFTSIPKSIYWAIVTMTTVGYGDIAPQTPLGQILASILMVVGYGVIAVPTGIVTAELTRTEHIAVSCPSCGEKSISAKAKYCWNCGAAYLE
jgi:voltage-gated potassium channel